MRTRACSKATVTHHCAQTHAAYEAQGQQRQQKGQEDQKALLRAAFEQFMKEREAAREKQTQRKRDRDDDEDEDKDEDNTDMTPAKTAPPKTSPPPAAAAPAAQAQSMVDEDAEDATAQDFKDLRPSELQAEIDRVSKARMNGRHRSLVLGALSNELKEQVRRRVCETQRAAC